MSKRLLIITCHRLSDNNGGANASKGFIHCFASLFSDCSLIFPEFDNPSLLLPANVKQYPCHDSRSKLHKGFDMYRGVVNALYSCVKDHLKFHTYDVVVIDHSVTGTGIIKALKATGAKLITIHHNVERDYLHDNGNERPITFRYPYNYFAKKSERDCLKYSDVNLTLTQKDSSEFNTWFNDRNLHLHCLGICEYKPIPVKGFSSTEHETKTFVITGSLCFIQSELPVTEFVNVYFPILKKECPKSRLVIAGRNPSSQILKVCAEEPDIQVVANPENMTDIVKAADYYICPISAGSGIKLRIMDGLKQGLPVICHKVSEYGYEALKDKGCLFSYDDKESFRDSLKNLLMCNVSKAEVYDTFRDTFSFNAVSRKLEKILHEENIL